MSVNANADLNLNFSFASTTNMFTHVYSLQNTTRKQACQICQFFPTAVCLFRTGRVSVAIGRQIVGSSNALRCLNSVKKWNHIFKLSMMHKSWPHGKICVLVSFGSKGQRSSNFTICNLMPGTNKHCEKWLSIIDFT